MMCCRLHTPLAHFINVEEYSVEQWDDLMNSELERIWKEAVME